ncbi:MAG: hypothetical protein JW797_13350 [Bradymonadales bacterium]|nr:hypothetical protein [Bradymonadales bacterium]
MASLCLVSCDDAPIPTGETSYPLPSSEPSRESAAAGGTWRPGEEQAQQEEIRLTLADFEQPAGALLPRPNDLGDWVYRVRPTYYSAATLFELIDGGADSFLEQGFVQAANAVLGLPQSRETFSREATLELSVFTMRSEEAAASKYELDHREGRCEHQVRIVSTHCTTSSSLDLVVGRHYLRLLLDRDHPSLLEPMLAIAEGIQARAALGGP